MPARGAHHRRGPREAGRVTAPDRRYHERCVRTAAPVAPRPRGDVRVARDTIEERRLLLQASKRAFPDATFTADRGVLASIGRKALELPLV